MDLGRLVRKSRSLVISDQRGTRIGSRGELSGSIGDCSSIPNRAVVRAREGPEREGNVIPIAAQG